MSALALAACSSGATAAGAGSTSTSATAAPSTSSAAPAAQAETKPTAGQCRHATGEQVGDQAAWDGTPPRACGGPHNAETTFVGTIPNSDATPFTALPNDVMALVTSSCTDAQLKQTFGADVTALQDTWWATGEGGLPAARTAVPLLVAYSYFFPTAASWASGTRWFRRDIGSPPSYDSPNRSDAPRAFKDVLRTDPRFFAICSDKAFTAAPTVSDTPTSSFDSYKPCNATSPWKLTASWSSRRTRPSDSPVPDKCWRARPPNARPHHPSARRGAEQGGLGRQRPHGRIVLGRRPETVDVDRGDRRAVQSASLTAVPSARISISPADSPIVLESKRTPTTASAPIDCAWATRRCRVS